MKPLYCTKGHENLNGSRFCHQCGELLSQPNAAGIVAGIILGDRYRIVRQLGQGGFGRAYLAEDINRFNERCVLKEFAPQVQGTYALQKGQELFEREAGVLYKLQHPQIPRFREMFRANVDDEGRLFLVQDFVDGQTYRTLLANRKVQGTVFSEPEIIQLLLQILPVLEYIHSQNVVHRDISPDNLMLRNSDLLPVLIDFGGVKQVAATLESQFMGAPPTPATRLGKAGYAPDEQMQIGVVYPHSDLYALAVTMLVLLTNKPPQELRDSHTLMWKWHEFVSLSPNLAAVFEKMLAHRPGDRFQSVRQVREAIAGNSPTPNYPVIPPTVLPPQPHLETTQATQAVSPPLPISQPIVATSAKRKAPTSQLVNLLLMFVIIVGIGSVGWLIGNSWSDRKPPEDDQPAIVNDSEPDPSDKLPAQEQQRKDELRDRRRQLGIDYDFYVNLINEAFYSQYPEQQGQILSDNPVDEVWRERWDTLAAQMMDRLENVSESTRLLMGKYSLADINRWKEEINKLHLSSRALYDLADAKFFSLFPEQTRGENLIDKPIGQVWFAIANEQRQAVQNGTILEEIKFAPGSTGTQLSNTLNPGTGKAYIALLSRGQFLRLNLDANGSTLLSIYPPSSKKPALLQDAQQVSWSGRLADAGYYEIVVVSEASEPISYQLNISADR